MRDLWSTARHLVGWAVVVGVMAALSGCGKPLEPLRDGPALVPGMELHVDSVTGCHYLSYWRGGITARMATDGKHFGCKGAKD